MPEPVPTLRALWRGSPDAENQWVLRIAALRGSLMDRSPVLALRWSLLPLGALAAAAMLGVPHAHRLATAAFMYAALAIAFMAPARGIGARRRFIESPLRDESRLTLLRHSDALAGMHARVLLGTLHALAFALIAGVFLTHELFADAPRTWRSDLGLLIVMTPIGRPSSVWEPWLLPWMVATVVAASLSFAAGYYLRASILATLPHRGPAPVIASCLVIAATLFAFFMRMDFAREWCDRVAEPQDVRPAPLIMCAVEGAWALLSFAAALAIWKWLLAHPEELGFGED